MPVGTKRLITKHRLATRWAHWINFLALAVMIWSGLLIYWADPEYRAGAGSITLFRFFPQGFFALFHLNQRLAEGMAWHFCFMWFFVLNGIAYVAYTVISGEWRALVPKRRSFRDAIQVALHDLHVVKRLPPQGKYNGAQQIAYTAIILMGAGSIATGLAIYKPIQLNWLTALLGGYRAAHFEHFWLMIGYVLFFVVHVTQVARAGWSNFQAMVTGYEVTAGGGDKRAGEPAADREVEHELRRLTRRSFLWGAASVAGVLFGWRWLITRRPDDGTLWPLRRVLQTNEELARDYFRPTRLAPTFDRSRAIPVPRVNGDLGLGEDFDRASWRLQVYGLAHPPGAPNSGAIEFTLEQLQTLPFTEMVTEHHCIEGWTQIVHWGGVRFRDFLAAYPPVTRSGGPADIDRRPDDLPEYVSLTTPDGGYYVGLDRASALHPQTLLCYLMNGAPLTLEHGAPLRLVIPVKYGVKYIKRIGAIRFANSRPADYWAEQGYDWYIGL